jgi:para-aminobenzoate synthetase component 1
VSQVEFQPDLEKPRASEPVVAELSCAPDVSAAFARFASQPNCLLLESSRASTSARGESLGRYSFLAAHPVAWLEVDVDSARPLAGLREWLTQFRSVSIPGLPPFQGGLAGLISYDLNRSFEKIKPTPGRFPLPAIAIGLYDTLVAWDHEQDRAWILSHGIQSEKHEPDCQTARERIERFRQILAAPPGSPVSPAAAAIPASSLGQRFEVPGPGGLVSNFSRDQYVSAVERAIEYIYAGDVFQINLAQQLLFPAKDHASQLYLRLRRCNPAPFSGYFDVGDSQIVSASPERLIGVRNRVVETRPIKGTRKRTRFPEVDLHAENELKTSEKDRAENIMIVDLMRNDLSRVCEDHSVSVPQLCELEQYESVLHLVSSVRGKLKPEADIVDLIRAVFPGGSITGAPKVRAMEIIAELEQTARGAYCGSLGYIGLDGTSDFNILIRSITNSRGWCQIPVGGGIVAQSDPDREYQETWTKAAGMLRALTP